MAVVLVCLCGVVVSGFLGIPCHAIIINITSHSSRGLHFCPLLCCVEAEEEGEDGIRDMVVFGGEGGGGAAAN